MAANPSGVRIAGMRAVFLPHPIIAAAATAGPLWRTFGNRILHRARDLCPVSHEEMEAGQLGPAVAGGDLKESMECRFVVGEDPRILIGSKLATKGAGSPNLLGLVLQGTEPHPIDGDPVLSFVWHGERVFFGHVDHPGTKANPFVQEAMKQIVHETGGVTVTT